VNCPVKTIAFPAISTGACGFPLDRATRIAVTQVKEFLEQHPSLERVLFVCFGEAACQTYRKTLEELT
jgi:O-acetyl-ADP-ribose deacetylase